MEYNFISLLFLSLCFSCSIQTDNEETYKSTLLQIQAKDKNYEDITSDTIIFAVKDYYSGKKDFPNAALAAFYCGRLLQEQNNLEKATTAYLEAKKYADHINDDNLKGLIQGNLGILYYYQFVTEKAIENGKEAAVLYHKAKNYKNEISSFLLVGNCFLLKNENDSAFYYYNKGLRLADYYKLQTEQVYIRQSIGVVYQRKGNYIKAKDFLHEAFAFSADSIEKARLLMNIANVYNLENQIDSAKFYIEKSLAIQAKEP
ncbi:MAG: tetratricopeptide repeat protein, partial [Dysgonamonadaceae bacterium]|nr:tetratricopeptide repeat protein [Dysgonamonadaceae bacterium]